MNDLEVWEVGAALGSATVDAEAWVATNRPASPSGALQSGDGRDLVAERVAHAQGLGPAPEAKVMDPIQVKALQEALRVS